MKFLANRKFFVQARLLKPANLLFFAVVLSLFAVFTLLFAEARFIYQKTERTLEKERQNHSKQNVIPFSKADLTPHKNQNIQIIQSAKNVRAIAAFQNSLYVATDGGLLQLNENGEIMRHLTVLDGLPESDLTSLAVFQSKLFIGTKSKGLIDFDGEKFSAFRLENHETKSITALVAGAQKLLIGTFSGGLLEFDGARLSEIKALNERIAHITFLREYGADLLVGTFADGFWLRKNQIWKHFRSADGLFSNRIIGAEVHDKTLFVATDLGVSQAVFDDIAQEMQSSFSQTVALPTLSGFIALKDRFFLTTDNGEIFSFSNDGKNSSLKKIVWKTPENLQTASFFHLNDELYLLSSQGVWKSKSNDTETISLAQFTRFSDKETLTDNNISALAIDGSERLWVGTFRNGIDVFSANGQKLKHLESETTREINSFALGGSNLLTATSGGAMGFDKNFNESFFVENAALPNRSITQISNFKDGEKQFSAISTIKGLVLIDKNSRRLFSTINGLPSNSVFATIFARNSLFAATMSGLAQIENGKVTRVFKTSNSELKNNWISALALADDRIFIGTYGGGIFELMPSGEIRGFESETGQKLFVNPNALFADGERLYAGTLAGVWVLDLTTQKWSHIKDVLPAETVLSITGDGAKVFFGTINGIARIDCDELRLQP